jgi:hypothetical protein
MRIIYHSTYSDPASIFPYLNGASSNHKHVEPCDEPSGSIPTAHSINDSERCYLHQTLKVKVKSKAIPVTGREGL